jgi:hypothetical protein
LITSRAAAEGVRPYVSTTSLTAILIAQKAPYRMAAPGPDPTITIISAILSSSAIAGVLTYFQNKKLKHLESELANKAAERDARRDYEYEAKKRLYHEIEPYLFLFSELSESALPYFSISFGCKRRRRMAFCSGVFH